MRDLVLDGARFTHLQVRHVPSPRPGPNQMLARVDATEIHTSLIKLVEQVSSHPMLYGWDITRYRLILGDEGSITLVEVGANLQKRYSPASVTCSSRLLTQSPSTIVSDTVTRRSEYVKSPWDAHCVATWQSTSFSMKRF